MCIQNKNKENLITQKDVKNLFDYKDGNLIWKVAKAKNIKPGKIAGTLHPTGYINIIIDGKLYKAHRLIWLYHHGKWPSKLIDHINRNKSDNRIENLREVSNQENQRHTKISSRNTSGICGVICHKASHKWQARITFNKKQIHLGSFHNQEDAIKARKAAEEKYNFSPFHGNVNPLPNVVNL